MLVGITVQNINHPSYSELGHYLNIRWQAFANEVGFTLIPLTSIALTKKMVSEKYIKAVILSGGGNLSKEFSSKNLKVIRPRFGVLPIYFNKLVNKRAPINLKKGVPIKDEILKKLKIN